MNTLSRFLLLAKIGAMVLLFICCGSTRSLAQHNRRISGIVTDSTKTGLPNVKVSLIIGKDTLITPTDEYGNFSFSKVNTDVFSLQVSTIGYQDFKSDYTFAENEKHKRLEPIKLKISGRALKEVVVRAKPNPIRFMQDTIEFNAAAFRVEEGDNVADLMKQFPGMLIDDAYNVTAMGKPMTKLRINGKDFFTSNVKDFIAKLPAGIVSKIQIIDDFGDYANFTGIKMGEPTKLLNIVTKPGMNKGSFGHASVSAGTNDMIGSQAQLNLWNDSKQNSANVNANTANNGAGRSKQFNIGISHYDRTGKNSSGGFNYNFNNNTSAFNREQVMESLNPEGNFINNTKSEGDNKGGNHSLSWNMNYNNNKFFMQTSVSGTYNYSGNQNISSSQQYGLIRQDLNNSNSSTISTPSLNAGVSLSKKLKDQKNIFSVSASISLSGNSNAQSISTNTLYYDKATGALLKDSILNRNVDSRTNVRNFNFGFNYSLGLKKPKDTLARQSLNFVYNGSAGSSTNNVSTFVFDNKSNKTFFVDSLSSSFSSILFNQSLGVNYNYGSNKMRYNIGLNTSVNMLRNSDFRLGQTITNNALNYAPNLNFSRMFTGGKTLSVSYQGSTRNPDINQLQPIRNSQSLQNILVGNPDLKTSFSHNLYANFNYANKSGRSMQLSINAFATQNEIVNDVILLPDTLNSLKQVTRYENINGNYRVNGNYLIHIPFNQNKFSVGYSGGLGFSNRAILYNHQKSSGKGFNLSQQVTGSMQFKKISLNAQLNYTLTSNNNNSASLYRPIEYQTIGIDQISKPTFFRTTTLGASIQSNLRLEKLRLNTMIYYNTSHNDAANNQVVPNSSNLNINLGGEVTIMKSFFADFGINERVNYGYALANSNIMLVNAGVGKRFLKDKTLNVSIRGNDLLAQGNKASRTVSGNTIIDSRYQQPTRIFLLSIDYSLSNFGGKHMRVDAD